MNDTTNSKTSDKVVDAAGKLWIVAGICEGVMRLVRGWGVTKETTCSVFPYAGYRDATAEEWSRYVASV